MAETVLQTLARERKEEQAQQDALPLSQYSPIKISDRRFIVVKTNGFTTGGGSESKFRVQCFTVISEKPLSWCDAWNMIRELQEMEGREEPSA